MPEHGTHGFALQDWLTLLEQRHPKSIDLGLARCGQVYARLGSPRPAARVVTVAGTNGKGSTVAYLSSLLQALGFSCGCYTSPHLLRFNERLTINGVAVTDEDLVGAFEQVEGAREGVSLTYFEFTTLACLWLMQRQDVDFAVLEVGMGGRLDTVNLVDADCAVIMPVGLDHQEFLGQDREAIGFEKAGIIRAGQNVVCAESRPPQSVLGHAGRLGAKVLLMGRDFDGRAVNEGLEFSMGAVRLVLPPSPLPGKHQLQNMSAALAALAAMDITWLSRAEALVEGFARTWLAGRMQTIGTGPLVLCDVGHNPMAAEAVAAHLAAAGHQNVQCVLGMLADKDAAGVAVALKGCVTQWHCASLRGTRGQKATQLAGRIVAALDGPVMIDCHDTVPAAIDCARRVSGIGGVVLVFGSFDTAAQALQWRDAQA